VQTSCGEQRGASDAYVSTFSAKKFGFFEIYGVSARIMGGGGKRLSQYRRQFFVFCADVFYGQPLKILFATNSNTITQSPFNAKRNR